MAEFIHPFSALDAPHCSPTNAFGKLNSDQFDITTIDVSSFSYAERLTATLSDVMGIAPEATHVIINEHDKRNWSVGGVRYIDK